jgi:hypothetical protein
MSEKRTITINPDFLKFSSGGTRKKPPKTDGNMIKVKSDAPKKRDNTLKKKSILRMIRQHQEDKYKKLFENKKPAATDVKNKVSDISDFESDFERSKNYLLELAETTKATESQMNKTLKQYPNQQPESLLFSPSVDVLETVSMDFPDVANSPPMSIVKPRPNFIAPTYGCLKNGSLPTYRNYINTQKNQPILRNNEVIQINNPNNQVNIPRLSNISQIAMSMPSSLINNNNNITSVVQNKFQEKISENIKRMNENAQVMAKLQAIKQNKYNKIAKQKKIIRRTYKAGKSKVLPKVSVLVSNRTMRNNVTTKSQLLKQDDIEDVKKYLVKRGFIKIGSTAPNDVLRKMYESAVLICGEVQNHNPDNLLYNFLNDTSDVK